MERSEMLVSSYLELIVAASIMSSARFAVKEWKIPGPCFKSCSGIIVAFVMRCGYGPQTLFEETKVGFCHCGLQFLKRESSGIKVTYSCVVESVIASGNA